MILLKIRIFPFVSPTVPRPAIRSLLAGLLPVLACLLQWLCWPVIAPFAWFLFYPVVFISSWLGGFAAGLAAAGLSVALAWWFFLPPVHVLLKPTPATYLNAAMFMGMGWLFSRFHQLLREANLRAVLAERKEQNDLLDRTSRMARVGGWEFQVATLQGSWSREVARIHDLDPETPADVRSGINYYHEEDRPIIAEAVRRVVEEAVPYDLELRLVSAKGVTKWVHTYGSPVLVDGRVVKVQGALQDVTERKQMELALRESNATLERRVAERTLELQAANQELESFASAVSHDLRAPLRAMAGFSQALQEDCAAILPQESMEHLDHIKAASQRMAGLIEGLLQLSRATRCELARVPVDLSALAESLLAELARIEPTRRVRLQIEPGLQVQGDPRTLESALLNLLGNAWKYTSKTPEASIRMDSILQDGQRWIRIQDNGCGFDMAFSDKLFKPFQRLHRQDEFPGLGIGLATVQRIVQRHGGALKAVSAPGEGAAFLMALPTAEPREIR